MKEMQIAFHHESTSADVHVIGFTLHLYSTIALDSEKFVEYAVGNRCGFVHAIFDSEDFRECLVLI